MTNKKILFLGPQDSPLPLWLKEQGEDVVHRDDRLSAEQIEPLGCDFLISYGYRYILKKAALDLFPDRAINLHISYLPWNRGADPNLWSFVDDTPKGVTIHYLDEGVDTGDIIVQKEVSFDESKETLATYYNLLHKNIFELFKQNWAAIKNGTCPRAKQSGQGTLHKIKDRANISHLLTEGWQTPVSKIRPQSKIEKQPSPAGSENR